MTFLCERSSTVHDRVLARTSPPLMDLRNLNKRASVALQFRDGMKSSI